MKKHLLGLLAEKRHAVITHSVTHGLNLNVAMKKSGFERLEEIPSHWNMLPVKYLARLELSNVDKLSVDGQKDVSLCNYVDVYKNEWVTSKIEFMRATASDEQIRRLSLRKFDILLTKDSETPDDIGVPALVVEELTDVVCGYHLAMLRPNPQIILGEFLFRALEAESTKSYFFSEAVGITRYGLDKNALANTPIPFPSIDEQQEIVGFINKQLSVIDKLVKLVTEDSNYLDDRHS